MTFRFTEASSSRYETDDTRRPNSLRNHSDDAEALRRRADALLDEMMLGGVDIGAGDEGYNGTNGGASLTNGYHEIEVEDHALYGEGGVVGHPSADADNDVPPQTSSRSEIYPSQPGPQTEARSWPGAGETQTAGSDVPAENLRTGSPYLVAAEDRYPRPASQGDARGEYANGTRAAVRRQSASYASSMTVGPRASLRSTLLPRSVETDTATAEQEIHALMSEISAGLPVGHEAAERSRHLLNKAENILQSDPTRTAEVDYYLQQVRRIVQRTRQSQTWSALYQRRLTIYLAAWIALSVVVLAGRYVLQAELLAFLEDFFWTSSDAIWVQFAPMTIGAIAAGSLGAATSVLLNMQRHAAQEYGYFDRKYGLRGLLLPLLGAVFGLALAVLWAAICYVVGLDGANVWIASLPALVAFLLGFAQEWLYGAR